MAEVIALWVNKGGTWKTTFTDIVPAILQVEKGKKVLVIDADPQANLTTDNGIDYSNVPTLYEVIKKAAAPQEVIINTRLFDILPAPDKIALENADLFGNGPAKEYTLKRLLSPLKGEYDYIFVDVGTGFGMLTMNALTFVDQVIFPVQPSRNSITGMEQSIENIAQIQPELNPSLRIRGMVLGKIPQQKVIGIEKQVKRAIEFAEAFNIPVFKTSMRHSFKIEDTEDEKTREDMNPYEAMPNEAFIDDLRELSDEILRGGPKNDTKSTT